MPLGPKSSTRSFPIAPPNRKLPPSLTSFGMIIISSSHSLQTYQHSGTVRQSTSHTQIPIQLIPQCVSRLAWQLRAQNSVDYDDYICAVAEAAAAITIFILYSFPLITSIISHRDVTSHTWTQWMAKPCAEPNRRKHAILNVDEWRCCMLNHNLQTT